MCIGWQFRRQNGEGVYKSRGVDISFNLELIETQHIWPPPKWTLLNVWSLPTKFQMSHRSMTLHLESFYQNQNQKQKHSSSDVSC